MSAKILVLALASSALVAAPALAFAQAMPAAPIPYEQFNADYGKMAAKSSHHHMAKKHGESDMAKNVANTASENAAQASAETAKTDEGMAKSSAHRAKSMAHKAKSEAEKANDSANAASNAMTPPK